ncbi:MAG: hypothetical protein N4A49_09540 [Marinifilaceae bacterium]|jgi:hypothetical protein|nr:hypothetical protein [Marinifilaceae bacterium]
MILKACDYINDIQRQLKQIQQVFKYDKLEITCEFFKLRGFDDEIFTDITTIKLKNSKMTYQKAYPLIEKNLKCFYNCIDHKPHLLNIRANANKTDIIFESDIAYPELGITEIEHRIEEENIYKIINKIYFDCEYISLDKLGPEKTIEFVELLGVWIKEHFDINQYIIEAKLIRNAKELADYYEKQKNELYIKLRNSLVQIANLEKKHALNKLLMASHFKTISFNNDNFEMANKSEVLKEFLFFLSVICFENFHLKIPKNILPEQTKFLNFLDKLPNIKY